MLSFFAIFILKFFLIVLIPFRFEIKATFVGSMFVVEYPFF